MSHVDHDILMHMPSISPDVTWPTWEICWGKQGDGLLSLPLGDEGGGGGRWGIDDIVLVKLRKKAPPCISPFKYKPPKPVTQKPLR